MIDFSCKHDVLIRSDNGVLRPMDEPFFESKLIAPGTWQILSDGDYSYLVEGEQEALVIDSGYGAGNIRAFCQALTSKPVWRIANTHDHFDHTANNVYFDCAYMSKETAQLATLPFPSFEGIDFPRDYPKEIIGEGYIFDLGGRELETFFVSDHAAGSLVFLDRKERILFSGDEFAMPSIRKTVAGYEKYLQKIASLREAFDSMCGGAGIWDPGMNIDARLENVQHILAGNEGVPAAQLERKGPSKEIVRDEKGRMIFGRRAPHPMDLPDHIGSVSEYDRVMEYAGCVVEYDVRKVYE